MGPGMKDGVIVKRVVLADDNKAVREEIKRLLSRVNDIQVIGEAEDGSKAIELVSTLNPDVLLLDVEMPKMNGVEVAREMKRKKINTPILVLSTYDDPEYIQGMLANGAAGYLIKDEAPERIIEAVRGVAVGQVGWVSPQVKKRLEQ